MSGRLFTIGHSNHDMDRFVSLLKQHGVEAVVDVRSNPSAQYSTHFDSLVLKPALEQHGIKYAFLGHELGGRPPGEEFYDQQGHVLYARVAKRPEFLLGIRRLENAVARMRLAIMCSEEDPTECHRRLLVGRVLGERGIGVDHVRGDGRVQAEEEIAELERRANAQLSLFPEEGDAAWKSTRSALPGGRPKSSSER